MFDMMEREETAAATDPVVRMRADLGEVSLDDLEGWNADGLSERLVELVEVRERLDAEVARVAALWQRRRGWEADGALSPVAWLTHRTPLAAREARLVVNTATVINHAPHLAAALHTGDTTTGHVGVVARVMSPQRQTLLGDHDEVLTSQASRLSIKDFALITRRWAALVDDHLATDTHKKHLPRNQVHASVTMDGWVDGTFCLDPISGSRLLGVLDHLAPPDPGDAPDGVRTLTQRRGDALADLAGWYHQGATPGANPPNLDVVVDVATLNGDTPDLARIRCDLEGIGPVTRATLNQLACDATIRRVVMAGDSVILDMGRKVRLATKPQTRAIRIRDTGCVFASCDRPAPWCDIHHITNFTKGGPTNNDNMVSLCRRHHTLTHNTKWTIQLNPDGTTTTHHPTRAP